MRMTTSRVDLKLVSAVARDLGIKKPLRIVSHAGPFKRECSCPDPTHKGRVFDGFHTVIDGTHEITVNVQLNPVRLTEVLAHELHHALTYELGRNARHDNGIPYRENPHEVEAEAFAARFIKSGLLLAA